MASTETRTGFRLPWVSETHPTSDTAPDADQVTEATEAASAGDEATAATSPAAEAGTATGTGTGAEAAGTQQAEAVGRAPAAAAARRPTKFLADLTRAMRSAAEAEREEILARFQADAKAFTESIHERSAVEATEIRSNADGDITGIREWSKAEIARIREETERRITERRASLDRELETHAARIERRIEHIHGSVDGFETQMSRFFETLLAEEDPTLFAELAANLPEPPSLEAIAAEDVDLPQPIAAAPAVDESAGHEAPEAAVATEPAAAADEAVGIEPVTPEAEASTASEPDVAAVAEHEAAPEGETTASVEAASVAEPVEADTPSIEQPAEGAADAARPEPTFDEDELTLDPRVAALGLTPDFGAAEAEAAQLSDDQVDDGSAEVVPSFDEATIAARLAGLVPTTTPTDLVDTRVTVGGLVSVASIAGFKRGLGRLPGVQSVSVSSGPDGEFVFAVSRSVSVDLAAAIATMPGYAARVTSATENELEVVAHDPDAA